MENDNQTAIDLYAPIALEHTRDQYSKAKINLEQQHLQLADLQEQLINQQAEKIESQLLLIRQKDATIIDLKKKCETIQSQHLVIREKEAIIVELRDELEKVRGVLTSIADITTPIRSKVPEESKPREEFGECRVGGDIAQQSVTAQVISRPVTMLRVDKELPAMPPNMEDYTIANRLELNPREQPVPHKIGRSTIGEPPSSPTRSQYGQRNSNAYTSPRALSTISLPPQVFQSSIRPDQSTPMSPTPRHPRYASPLNTVREISPLSSAILSARQGNLTSLGHFGSPSREGLRTSMLSPSLPKPKNESLAVKAISIEKAEKFKGPKEVADDEDEDAMRKKIRSEAEKRKEAAFSQSDKIERDSTILTYITTTQEGPTASNKSSTIINRLGSTSDRIGKKLADSKKKKPGIQKSSITYPSLNLLSAEIPREVRSKFSESPDTATVNDAEFGRITGLVDQQVSAENLPPNGEASGENRRYREGKTGKVMDRIRGWKGGDKG